MNMGIRVFLTATRWRTTRSVQVASFRTMLLHYCWLSYKAVSSGNSDRNFSSVCFEIHGAVIKSDRSNLSTLHGMERV